MHESQMTIAIVDDDVSLGRSLALHLEECGYRPRVYESGADALRGLSDHGAELVFLDIRLGDTSGLELLPKLTTSDDPTYVVMMTAFHDMETTVKASKGGAFDYMVKPLDLNRVDEALERVVAHRKNSRSKVALSAVAEERPDRLRNHIVGASPSMVQVFQSIGRIAPSDANVLIQGESGTGKELVARALHEYSERSGPFLSVNCATLSEEFLCSDLFGHEAGAFTGATSRRLGKFEVGHNGTLLLDEVGELSPDLQARLLRVLQEREFERLGGNKMIPTNARIIAATNRDLEAMVADDTFREDLFFRLNVLHVRVPTLRERQDDVPELAKHLLARMSRSMGKSGVGVTEAVLKRLRDYDWPGNVRELENVLATAMIRSDYGTIVAVDVGGEGRLVREGSESQLTLAEVEKRHIVATLESCRGNKTRTASVLNISRPTLDKRLAAYGVAVGRRVSSHQS